jgi:hypothetical protein
LYRSLVIKKFCRSDDVPGRSTAAVSPTFCPDRVGACGTSFPDAHRQTGVNLCHVPQQSAPRKTGRVPSDPPVSTGEKLVTYSAQSYVFQGSDYNRGARYIFSLIPLRISHQFTG